jgi:hypothetical protein
MSSNGPVWRAPGLPAAAAGAAVVSRSCQRRVDAGSAPERGVERLPTAPPVLNCHRWSYSKNFRRSCPCRLPTWCAMPTVWRRIGSSGRRLFRHRDSKVSTASKRGREPRIGTGQGCSAVFLIWIWQPARFAAVGSLRIIAAILPPLCGRREALRAAPSQTRQPCDLHLYLPSPLLASAKRYSCSTTPTPAWAHRRGARRSGVIRPLQL